MPSFTADSPTIKNCPANLQIVHFSEDEQTAMEHSHIRNIASNKSTTEKIKLVSYEKKVRFGSITIRRYQQTLGDHPVCSIGPPVTLDWDYQEDSHRPTVARYERAKVLRLHRIKLSALSYYKRIDLLQVKGFTPAQLQQATREVTKIQVQRKATQIFPPLFIPLLEVLETVARQAKWTASFYHHDGKERIHDNDTSIIRYANR